MNSIVTNYTQACAICGRPASCRHHLVFGTSERKKADEDGVWIPMCNECHNMGHGSSVIHGNSMAEALSKMLGQLAYEKEYYRRNCLDAQVISGEDPARKSFMERYGRSYL